MAYRYGNRKQMTFLPKSIEQYVSSDCPVRAYDAFVDALDFRDLGICLNPSKVGNTQYYPKTMLKLLIYSYSYGVKGSRKIERETHNNLTYMWLMGGLKPDHKTIAEFRRKNKKAIAKVLKQCTRMCIQLDLIAGNVLFVDGTKIRANAARAATRDKAYYEQQLTRIDERIEQLLEECETIDQEEQHLGPYVSMKKELTKADNLRSTIQAALEEFKETDREQINQTDPDCAIMHSIQGSHASYNVQSVVDDKNGLIVQAEAVSDTSDYNQLSRQIEQAQEITEKPCEVACADAGYADADDLEKVDSQGIRVIVPSQRQALHEGEKPFSKSSFTYDTQKDCYYCPQGHTLKLTWVDRKTGKRHYLISKKELCHQCEHYGVCTKAKRGRKIVRLRNEEFKEKLEAHYEEPESQDIYRKRKSRVEHPFGHIKRNLKTDGFLLRGRSGVQAETSVLGTCFNIARMITIFGIEGLIKRLRELSPLSEKAFVPCSP
jgi:transposase